MTQRRKAISVLTMSTLAFTVCFAVWVMNGVLITYLVDARIFDFDRLQMGWLIGIPILSGSVLRLPVGMLADKYGGRSVFIWVMLLTAVATYISSYANSFTGFLWAGLAFGLAGTTFAIGIAYCSCWFPKNQQGTALGIFGAGNAGAALTSLVAPNMLLFLTDQGANPEGWRTFPKIYALGLLVMTGIFWLFTYYRVAEAEAKPRTLVERLKPLKTMRVWRFGLYYFLVFGGFVALAQWLIPYYVSVYTVSIATAGFLAAIFTFPSGVIRAFGGWLSDKFGARLVLYGVLGGCALFSLFLVVPRMDIYSPGQGIMAFQSGSVEQVSPSEIVVAGKSYPLAVKIAEDAYKEGALILPKKNFWHDPVVNVGDSVKKKELIAKGVTHIYFQANIWVFTGFVFVIGILMGIGKAAVYKHIPEYFPSDVGVVGGAVGLLGGLGGFFCPVLFGYLLKTTGIWPTCWMFFFLLSMACLIWMHLVIKKMLVRVAPHVSQLIDELELPQGRTDWIEERKVICPKHHASATVTIHQLHDDGDPRLVRCILLDPDGLKCKHCIANQDLKTEEV